jgi:vacuolar protein sorting-associated protein 54
MLRDAEHFKARIGSIDGAGDTGDHLLKLVKEKDVPKPTEEPKVEAKTELQPEPAPLVKELEAAQINGNGSAYVPATAETKVEVANGVDKEEVKIEKVEKTKDEQTEA